MVSKNPGGKITGLLALSCEAQYGALVGDWVHLVGDYEVAKADGTKPVLGRVSVRNVKRDATTHVYPVADNPGPVTVEVAGGFVSKEVAGAAIDAGEEVSILNGEPVPADAVGASGPIGIALTGAADGEEFDLLAR